MRSIRVGGRGCRWRRDNGAKLIDIVAGRETSQIIEINIGFFGGVTGAEGENRCGTRVINDTLYPIFLSR